MPKIIPAELSGVVDGDQLAKASGITRECGIRRDRSTFTNAGNIAAIADTLSLGTMKAGNAVRAFEITATTNMAAASIAIGTAAVPDKYRAAAVLPGAGASQRRIVLPTAAGFAPLTEDEEIIATVSGAPIPAGSLLIDTEYSRR